MKKHTTYPAQAVHVTGNLRQYDPVVYLNSNDTASPGYLAVGKTDEVITDTNGFESLKTIWEKHKDWMFGYLNYDLKNEVEKLRSENPNGLQFPLLHFYRPAILLIFRDGETEAHYDDEHTSTTEVEELLNNVSMRAKGQDQDLVNLRPRINKEAYLQAVSQLQEHLQQGDICEVNFCQEFFAEEAMVDPHLLYEQLNNISPTPFSCFYRNDDKYLLCASPERVFVKPLA